MRREDLSMVVAAEPANDVDRILATCVKIFPIWTTE